LGTAVSYAYAVKAGPWIFLTGHEAFDFESGIPQEVAGPSGFPLYGRPRSRREASISERPATSTPSSRLPPSAAPACS